MFYNFLPALRNVPELLESLMWAPIVRPLGLRSDPMGNGVFRASRAGGKRKHNGFDLLVNENQEVFAPTDGLVARVAYPYGTGEKWHGVEILLSGVWSGYSLKIFYMVPLWPGRGPSAIIDQPVQRGQLIGHTQGIARKYGNGMKNHIHVEVRHGKECFNPEPLIFSSATWKV